MSGDRLIVPHRYRSLIDSYQSMALVFLEEKLGVMFSIVEPVMIDFASKAEADNAQTVFFDAINHIADQQDNVTRFFLDVSKAGFKNYINGIPIVYPRPIIETDDEAHIGIVEDRDLEVHIALQSMITKARNKNHQDLYQLTQRLSVIRHGKKVANNDVPVCPAHVVTTFQSAAIDYDLEQKILLILYVLFEKSVLNDISVLYKQVNLLLSEAGIYPHLAPVIDLSRKEDNSTRENKSSEVEKEKLDKATSEQKRCRTEPLKNEDFEIGEEVFRSILSLLTERRRSDPRFKNHPEYLPDGNLEQLRSKPDLVSAINQVALPNTIDDQITTSQEIQDSEPAERKAAIKASLTQRIFNEREVIYQELDTNTIPTADLDTIELVGMLFEHILDDDDLASLTKALICHLHTPYLKLAIIDPAFLTDPEHVARKLLNLLVNAGRRWVDENNLSAGIYNNMHDLIQTLMSEFKDDITVFEQGYNEFIDNLSALEHKTKLLEERTKEATRGKDRLEYSRIYAEEVLAQHCAEIKFHPVLAHFLYSFWKNYITLLLLRNPEVKEGKEWRSVLMVINSIVKANEAPNNLDIRRWLKNTLPGLKRHIKEGVEFIGTGSEPVEYTELCLLFDQWISANDEPLESVSKEQLIQPAPVSTHAHKKLQDDSPQHKSAVQTVQQTRIGSWFEFDEPDGKVQRVKLSWYSPVTNNHMFIDRFGYKAFILPTEVLVTKLVKGSARIVEPNRFPFVDQTLIKISGLLRS